MVGASPEQVLARKPPGWLERPLPGGRPGFRMISPGKMPGSRGAVTYYGSGSPEWLDFPTKPEPWLFVLNSAAEHELLVQILAAWALPAESPGAAVSDIPRLADATQRLVRDHLIQVFRDSLDSEPALPLEGEQAINAVADAHNWWRDETDATVEPATSILAIAITDQGREKLARAAHPSRSGFWPWHKRRSSDR